MKRLETTKANEIAKKLSEKYNETIVIYKGTPDARYANGYFAYAQTGNGYAAAGTYGQMVANSKTLKGLLEI